MQHVYRGVTINVNEEIPVEEAEAYIDRGLESYPGLSSIEATVDGEDIELTYTSNPEDFQRIRRITGYLVGDLSRFNDAKRAEVEERVKHGV